jgi:hypothetical protein
VAAVPSATVTIVEKSKDTTTVCARNDNAILLGGTGNDTANRPEKLT